MSQTLLFGDVDVEELDTRNFSYGQEMPSGIWNHKPTGEIVWKVLLFLPIVVFGLVGNFLIMLVIYKFKQTRNCTNLFIGNMALADFFATLLLTWAALANDLFQNYPLGAFYCRIESFAKGESMSPITTN